MPCIDSSPIDDDGTRKEHATQLLTAYVRNMSASGTITPEKVPRNVQVEPTYITMSPEHSHPSAKLMQTAYQHLLLQEC